MFETVQDIMDWIISRVSDRTENLTEIRVFGGET